MKNSIKTGVIATLLIYALGVTYTYYSNQKFDQQFEHFDLDKNGTINEDEKTEQSQQYVNALAKRKTTGQAIIVLIPVSVFLGLICFGIVVLFNKMKTIDKNEINYQ